uniref:CxC2-like cysteine cluster KDZ transposase-associated domain-containing protein n=1 Tax=Mycena chlorophos TaxID=658473 RepID=A0ABQ0LV88_MYCCL|nr:predicted protein [Mycena chlorophos]
MSPGIPASPRSLMAPAKQPKPKRVSRRHDDFFFDSSIPNASADHSYVYADDGRRTEFSLMNTAPVKRPRLDSDILSDDEAAWMPNYDQDVLAAVAESLTTNDVYVHVIDESEVSTKRKRYQSSDDPMGVWRPSQSDFLDHLLRHDGLGDRHERQPLHVIEEWDGEFWTKAALHRLALKDASRYSLGSVYQLGHEGHPCVLPASLEPKRMVVVDVKGIFVLDVRFCGCARSHRHKDKAVAQLMEQGWYPATTLDPQTCATFEALELFRSLNVVGNVNAHDFVGSLERLTDPTQIGDTP